MEKLVLKFKNGEFVSLDSDSGFYPFPVKDVFRAECFTSETEATKYISMFDDIENRIYRVTVSIS